MKLLLTGGTGFIGSRVLDQLLAAGHTVTALVRTEEAAKKLAAKGAKPLIGDLTTLDVIKRAAADSDGVVHLAYIHDFANYEAAGRTETAFLQAVAEALAGMLSTKILILAGLD